MYRLASNGRLTNHLRRAWRAPAFNVGSEDPAFPIARAFDHRAGSAAFFLDTEPDSSILLDKDVIIDGDFSTDELEGWVVTDGDISAIGQGEGTMHQDHPAAPGELWSVLLDLTPGEGGEFHVSLRNQHTGRYLNRDGSWTDAFAEIVATEDQDPVELLLGFRVESFAACGTHEVSLRLEVTQDGDADCQEVAMWPHTDLVGVFGYNYAPGGLVPTISGNSFEKHLRRDGPRVLWAHLGECKSDRTLILEWTGTPVSPIGFGELVLAQTTRIARANVPGGVAPRPDLEIELGFANDRAQAPSGALYVSPNGSDVGARAARMSFMLINQGELTRLRDEVFASSQGGVHPSILLGPTAIGDVCMFGRFEDRMPATFPGGNREVIARVELGFQEDAFPRFGAPA